MTPRRDVPPFLAFFVAAFVLCVGSLATATTAIKLDLESLVANSDQIVVGEVVEVESFRRDGTIMTDAIVEIDDAWKGAEEERVTVRRPGGRIGDVTTYVPGVPSFESGQRLVLFLEQTKGHVCVPTGLAQGAFRIVEGPDDSTRFVVPYLGDLNLVSPSKGGAKSDDDDSNDAAPETKEAGPSERVRQLKTRLESTEPSGIHESTSTFASFRQRVQSTVRAQETSR